MVNLISSLKAKISIHIDSVGYWRKLGANIGDGCHIYPSASLGSEPYLIEIGNHVRINNGVIFVTHDGGLWVVRGLAELGKVPVDAINKERFGKISIGNKVHIGTNSIIMPNVHIGNNCVIGCGAIVTKSIPDNSVAVGVPAKVIETVYEYYEKNNGNLVSSKEMSSEEKKKFLQKKYKNKNFLGEESGN